MERRLLPCLLALLLLAAPHDAKMAPSRLAGTGAALGDDAEAQPRFARPAAPALPPHLQPLAHTHNASDQAPEDQPVFVHSYAYTDEEGRNVTFTYEVEHRSEATVFALDHMAEVVRLTVKHDPYAAEVKTAELVLDSAASARAWKDALSGDEHAFLSGGTHWGHRHRETGEPDTVFFRVTAAMASARHPDTLNLELEEAHFVDVFKNADVQMSLMHARNDLEHHSDVLDASVNFDTNEVVLNTPPTASAPAAEAATSGNQAGPTPSEIQGTGEHSMPDLQDAGAPVEDAATANIDPVDTHLVSRQLLGGGKSVLGSIKQRVGVFVKKGLNAVATIGDLTKSVIKFTEVLLQVVAFSIDALDGTAEFAPTVGVDILNVNYDAATDSSVCEISFATLANAQADGLPIGAADGTAKLTGTCHDCYAYTGVSINVHLKIADHKLMRAAVWAEGKVLFKYAFSMELSGEGNYAAAKKIFEYKIPAVKFIIAGVPCLTSGKVPIYIGAEGVMEASVQIESFFKLEASVKLGFEWLPGKGVQLINKLEFKREGGGISPVAIKGSMGLQFYIMPTVHLVVNYVGGPVFSIKAYIEGIINADISGLSKEGKDADGKKCFAEVKFNAAVGVIGSLGARVKVKVGKLEPLVEKNIEPVGLITLKEGLYDAQWRDKNNLCKEASSTSGRKLQNEHHDAISSPNESAFLMSNVPAAAISQPEEAAGARWASGSSASRKLLQNTDMFSTNITGACIGKGQSSCMNMMGCGWCIHYLYCSILPTVDGICQGYKVGYGEPKYKPYFVKNGAKSYDYVGTCVADTQDGKNPGFCDAGDNGWFTSEMAAGQKALGTKWATVGKLVSGKMVKLKPNDTACAEYPEYMSVFGQVLTDIDSIGNVDIAFAFSVGTDNVAKDNNNSADSYAAVTQVKYSGTIKTAEAGVNFLLQKSTIAGKDISDLDDIFFQGSSREIKYEIPRSYGYVYPGTDGKLRIDLYDSLLCTRTDLVETSVALGDLTAIDTGVEGFSSSTTSSGVRRLQATSTPKVWTESELKVTCPWAQRTTSGKTCCRVCHKGKACGHTCIAKAAKCSIAAPGCACDATDVKFVAPTPPSSSGGSPGTSTTAPTPSSSSGGSPGTSTTAKSSASGRHGAGSPSSITLSLLKVGVVAICFFIIM
mmetsp:Transcript_17483/g.43138  ORF Transcript_17483/g.43138 Transcript_17483/m.43138 type:complete len:1160 (+) Transcript_17483:107-3586(+)|eukprot:CAMPEP_0197582002 /NCGR_PEP_ID=MMETSP1326-20131121/5349_1 /TAXON_ID=1155430 /ORGANISM="Genus nov. species nov., Strain RCC2288" /LENGTH=1159 /DNA_ID=CAMNT_0043146005 /DNA_START=108 /DNA_END=3587 /DNA_ORIENTATION=-